MKGAELHGRKFHLGFGETWLNGTLWCLSVRLSISLLRDECAEFLLLGSPLLGSVMATLILLTHSFFGLANTID